MLFCSKNCELVYKSSERVDGQCCTAAGRRDVFARARADPSRRDRLLGLRMSGQLAATTVGPRRLAPFKKKLLSEIGQDFFGIQ